MQVRPITEAELIEARNISSVCFEWSHENRIPYLDYMAQIKDFPKDKSQAYWAEKLACFDDDGTMMSVMSAYPYDIYFDSKITQMRGVAAVCSYPQYKRKGAVRAMLTQFLHNAYEKGVPFSYLHPFNEEFYYKFGYAHCSKSEWRFALEQIPDIKYSGSFSLYRGEKDIMDFETAYARYAIEINMMIERDIFDWHHLTSANPFLENKFAYLYKDECGSPSGYFIFEPDGKGFGKTMKVQELAFDSFDTLKAIMGFIKSFLPDYKTVSFHTPRGLNLDWFCRDFVLSESFCKTIPNGMVRAVCVDKVLKLAKYKGDGEICIKITDPVILANTSTFFVRFMDDTAVTVEKTDRPHDVEMTVNMFSSAILGVYSQEDYYFSDEVSWFCDNELFDKVFYKKPHMIMNYF